MAVEKRKYTNRTSYRAYWRNPYTGKIERGPARDTLKEARRDDAEIKVKLEFEPETFMPGDYRESSEHTLNSLSKIYLARDALAETTRKQDYYHFVQISPIIGHIPAASIARDDLRHFEAEQLKAGVKQNTIQRRISIVRAILNWAVDSGLIAENQIQGYRCKRGEDLKLPPPSPSETRLLISEAPPHLKRAIILGYYLGVRVGASELLALKWEDYDPERKRIRVWSAKKNKARPWRDLDIVPPLFTLMESWRLEDAPLDIKMLVSFRNKPIKNIKRSWSSALKRAGITRRIRPYDLRHAFATEAIAAGADIKAVADSMGHSDTSMIHKHYQHVVDEQKRKVMESIPDVLSGIQGRDTKQELSGHFSYPEKIIFQ